MGAPYTCLLVGAYLQHHVPNINNLSSHENSFLGSTSSIFFFLPNIFVIFVAGFVIFDVGLRPWSVECLREEMVIASFGTVFSVVEDGIWWEEELKSPL